MKRRNFLLYSSLFLASCSVARTSASDGEDLDRETLRLAVSDVRGEEELERDYGSFRAALASVLDTKVEFVPVENTFDAVAALELDRVDLVWAGPSEYITINARTNAMPLVGISRPTTRAIVATRADRGISSLTDLKGKAIEMGKVGLTNNHLLPIKLLLEAGLDPTTDVRILHSPNYDFKALDSGEADAWARASHRYELALQEQGASAKDYPIIAEYAPIPHDTIVVSNYIEPDRIERMRADLLENAKPIAASIAQSETLGSKFSGSELVAVGDTDYNVIREVYRAIGKDELVEE